MLIILLNSYMTTKHLNLCTKYSINFMLNMG